MYGNIVEPDSADEAGEGAVALPAKLRVPPALTAAIAVCALAALVLGAAGVSLITG
jgi:hypothetical protein